MATIVIPIYFIQYSIFLLHLQKHECQSQMWWISWVVVLSWKPLSHQMNHPIHVRPSPPNLRHKHSTSNNQTDPKPTPICCPEQSTLTNLWCCTPRHQAHPTYADPQASNLNPMLQTHPCHMNHKCHPIHVTLAALIPYHRIHSKPSTRSLDHKNIIRIFLSRVHYSQTKFEYTVSTKNGLLTCPSAIQTIPYSGHI